MPTTNTITESVRHRLLIEAGHRCAVCGSATPLELAHIVPSSKARSNSSQDLICLCASCHERADRENWGEGVLRKYKDAPWVSRQRDQPAEKAQKKSRVNVSINIETHDLNDPEKRKLLQYALAAFLDLKPDEIKIVPTKEG